MNISLSMTAQLYVEKMSKHECSLS